MTDWEQKYLEEDTPWDKGEAAPGLVKWLKNNKPAQDTRVLVPGCGRGHDANAWAKAGYETTGLDLSNLALNDARTQYDSQPGLAFFTSDFLHESPDHPFDFIFEHTLYCAIDPSKRDEYADAIKHWLKPNGYFLAIHFIFPLSEEGPPFGGSKEEIISRFSPFLTLLDDWKPNNFTGRENEEHMFYWQRSSI